MRNTSVFDRALPSNIEAERTILGAIILDDSVLASVRAELREDEFFLDSHKRIYRAMLWLNDQGRAVDYLLLQDRLRDLRELDLVGGVAFLGSLIDGVPRFSNVDEYVRLVKGKALIRGIILDSNAMINMAFENEDSPEGLLVEQARLHKARAAQLPQPAGNDQRTLVNEVYREIAEAYQNPSLMMGIRTGFQRLDYATNGIEPQDLITLAAGSSMGKTTWALQVAMNAANGFQAGRRVVVGYVTLEMTPKRLIYKAFSSRSGLGVRQLKTGRITEQELDGLGTVADQLQNIDMEYLPKIKGMGAALGNFVDKLRMKTNGAADVLIFVDTLQLFARAGDVRDQFAMIARASEENKQLTISHNCAIVQLSQLTTHGKYDVTEEPTEAMLRGAKSIYHDSDKVFFLHAPEGLESTRRQLIKRKDRDGERKEYFELTFNGTASRFEEV